MIDRWNAVWAGLVGGLAMSLTMSAARAMGRIDVVAGPALGCPSLGAVAGLLLPVMDGMR